VIGIILGVASLFAYISSAWSGHGFDTGFAQTAGRIVVALALGLLLFPRTIGMMFTPVALATPIGFVVGLIRHSVIYGFQVALLGLAALLCTVLISMLRPSVR
jgi:hypothetical protein